MMMSCLWGVIVCVSCECFRSQKYKNNFKNYIFVVLFSFVLPLFFKRTPFAFQKDSFCIPKGPLLPFKRTRFASQKDSFWKSVGFQVKSEKRKVKNPVDFK